MSTCSTALPRFLVLQGALLGMGLGAFSACTGGELDQTEPERAPLHEPTDRVAVVSLTWRPGEPGLAQAYLVDHAPGERKAALDRLGVSGASLLLESAPEGVIAPPGLLAGQCRVDPSSSYPLRAPQGDSTTSSPILLRDMGEILITAGSNKEVQQVLESSWLPEGSFDASGAAYSGLIPSVPTATRGKSTRDLRAPLTASRKREPRTVAVTADGSHEVGAFTASARLPEEVHILSVGGLEVRAGRVFRSAPTSSPATPPVLDLTDSTTGLEIVWARAPRLPYGDGDLDADATPQAEAGLATDLTYVVFERVGFGETWTITCAAEDDGAFVIPAPALISLPDLGAYQTDRVLVKRVAGASFSARGLPEGLLLVTSEDQAYLE